jgi:lipopolysaccharide/colanic/teichoic acid biosynthesis glycosyltransferase
MSLVGPRPEDPVIVGSHYTEQQRKTLIVRPGLVSPGTLYYYTHMEKSLSGTDPERDYVTYCLPLKLALDLIYIRDASLSYDLRLLYRAGKAILLTVLGQTKFKDPPELREAIQLVEHE